MENLPSIIEGFTGGKKASQPNKLTEQQADRWIDDWKGGRSDQQIYT